VNPRVNATILFLAAVVALPLPLWGLDGVFVPVGRLLQLAGAIGWLVAIEGTGGMVVPFFALFAVHAVAYLGLLLGARYGLARWLLPPISQRLRDHITVIAATLMIMLPAYGEFYDTRFHHTSAHAGLFELYR